MYKKLHIVVLTAGLAGAQTITTFAGTGAAGSSGDNGPATQAQINRPVGLAVDAQGNVYIAEENSHRVRKVDRNGIITTFAGTGVPGFSGDGQPATSAQLMNPTGVCTDTSGNVYINDNGNRRIRKVSGGTITTVLGNGSNVPGDGAATSVGAALPIRCATDRDGTLYFVDQGAQRVRKVVNGTVSTVAGTGGAGFGGDEGPATGAVLNNPTALAFNSANELFFTDQFNHRIRKITSNGTIRTFAFNGNNAYNGDGGPALSASSSFPGDLDFDRFGNLYIVDSTSARVRKVDAGNTITTIAGTGVAGFSGDNGNPLQAQLNEPFSIAIDGDNIYIGDTTNQRIRKIAVPPNVLPAITSAGVTNAASFLPGIAPGGMVTIFGANLGARAGEVITAPGTTWATTLSGIRVTMDGVAVPIYNVVNLGGTEQLTVFAPLSLVGKLFVPVVVSTSLGNSVSVSVPVLPAQPGIFPKPGQRGAITHADATGSLVTTDNPAIRGETIVIYLTGLGPVSNAPAAGEPATGLSRTTTLASVNVGGVQGQVAFSGLTPTYIGLYQVNVALPANVPSGTPNLTVEINGATSNVVTLDVR